MLFGPKTQRGDGGGRHDGVGGVLVHGGVGRGGGGGVGGGIGGAGEGGGDGGDDAGHDGAAVHAAGRLEAGHGVEPHA
jgi:hypothetical protein